MHLGCPVTMTPQVWSPFGPAHVADIIVIFRSGLVRQFTGSIGCYWFTGQTVIISPSPGSFLLSFTEGHLTPRTRFSG